MIGVHRDSGNKTAIAAVDQFAIDLANRFSSIVGCTRSWDTANPNDFEVCFIVRQCQGMYLNSFVLYVGHH